MLHFKRGKSDRSKLVAKLDVQFSKLIRERDKFCQYCKKSSVIYCHHIFSRRHLGTRFDPANAVSLCVYCHRLIAHGDPEKFRDFVIQRIGQEAFDKLKYKAFSSTKYSTTDLEWMLKEMKEGES